MKNPSSSKYISSLVSILALSLVFAQTVFAGGSGIQLTTTLSPTDHIAYQGVRSTLLNFNIHIEPGFVTEAKIKDITVTCFGPKILSRASLMSSTGRVLGSATFKSGYTTGEGGPMISAKIRPIGNTRINDNGAIKTFGIAITPNKNAPLQDVECGVSHVTFMNTDTRTTVAEGSILLDGYSYFENFVTQTATILATPYKPIHIQAK